MNSKDLKTSPYGKVITSRNIQKLAEVCVYKEGIQTGPFGSQLHSSDYVEDGTPIITVEHLGENIIEGKNPPLVHAEDVKRLLKYTMQAGDIIFSRVGSVDRRALVSEEQSGWLISGRLLRVRPDPAKADSRYLSYFFGLPMFKTYIRSIAVGATMPSLNTGLLSEVPVILPNISEQKAIGKVLSMLDEKIRINKELTKTLENIVQTIFKSWFIDFDPVKAKMAGEKPEGMDAATASLFPDSIEESELGLIPKGWKVETIGSICESVVNGSTPLRTNSAFWNVDDISWFKTGELSDNYLFESKESISNLALEKTSVKLLPRGSVLMAIYAAPTVGRLGILTKSATFNQACTGMVAKAKFGTPFLYLALFNRRAWFNSLAIGAAQQNISKVIVEGCPVVTASSAVHNAFSNVTKPIFAEIEALGGEINSLALIRDSLLPRLISGELQIPDEMLAS